MPERQPLPPLTNLLDGRRIDWERVVMQIQRSAWLASMSHTASLSAISQACGRNDTWAWQLKNVPGTEPKFHDGLMLLGLWSNVTGKSGAEIPTLGDLQRGSR